jgi:predicted DNA-binding protein YlxM (UPF0122 family)
MERPINIFMCIQSTSRPPRSLTPATSQTSDVLESVPQRIRELAMLRGLGYSFREIAQQLNVSPQAVSLMLSRHRRCLKSLRGAMELSQLSVRAVNALGRHGICTRDEALARNALELLRNERNCGSKTIEEIERWMAGAGVAGQQTA